MQRDERTFAMVKPDAFYRGKVADVIDRFEDAGLRIAMAYTTEPDEEQVRQHYSEVAEEHGEELMGQLVDYLANEPVMPMVIEGRNSVEKVRSMAGDTEPIEAPYGTIRGDHSSYSFDDAEIEEVALPNLVHTADSSESADEEIELWGLDDHEVEYRRPDMDWLTIKNSSYEDLPEEQRQRLQVEHGLEESEVAELYDDIIAQL